MSAAEASVSATTDKTGRQHVPVSLSLGSLVALLAAMFPLLRVVETGPWMLGAVLLTGAILLAGWLARWRGLPAVAASLIELVIWIALMTFVFLRETALIWFVPTPPSVRLGADLYAQAAYEITNGAAPLETTIGLSFVIVGAMGLLAIVVDHVVLTARMPLLAAVGLIAVSLIPSIAVPAAVDVSAFVLLAGSILFLLRAETRSRQAPAVRSPAARASIGGEVSATALGIGAIALVVAVVATPILPTPAPAAIAGPGVGSAIDPTLQLGDDLRRPREVEVLRLRSNTVGAPYLRAVTLSEFDGEVWEPDRARSVPLEEGLQPLTVNPDIRVTEYQTSIEVVNLQAPWLPVVYPAVGVEGLEGEWGAVPYNRTVVSRDGSTQGQTYDVVSNLPRPTLEQIRTLAAGGEGGEDLREELFELPADLPPVIAQTAAEVTASASNDYDRLVDLQSWFRSSEFSYSLEAPVEDGFDGSGAEAVAQFLERREGYCVHFASAFALMARSLGMPTRIVIGYLPGTNTSTAVEGQNLYSVSSSQLHAWPEVHFDGAGWIPFEPTNSLGTATSFSPAASSAGGPDALDAPDVDPNDPAAPTPSLPPTGADEDSGSIDAGGAGSASNPLPTLGTLAGIIAVLSIPALLGMMRRRRLLAAARRGDAPAAWALAQEAAIDLGIAVLASESPRSLGARLVDAGAPLAAMSTLVSGIERASYAPADDVESGGAGSAGGAGGARSAGGAELVGSAGLADAAAAVRARLRADATPRQRAVASLLPRSLVVRPGSSLAGSAPLEA